MNSYEIPQCQLICDVPKQLQCFFGFFPATVLINIHCIIYIYLNIFHYIIFLIGDNRHQSKLKNCKITPTVVIVIIYVGRLIANVTFCLLFHLDHHERNP